MLLEILNKLKVYRPDIEGFFLVLSKDWIDNDTIDIILKYIKNWLKFITDENERESIIKSMNNLQQLKQKEEDEREIEQSELDKLLDWY